MKILSKAKITAENLKDFTGEALLLAKRGLRKSLLKAFDIYKANVFYGIEEETEGEKAEILIWYQNLLDLNIRAFETVPGRIKRYV